MPFGFYLDTLSLVVFAVVALVGAVVAHYSRDYLRGDPGRPRFLRWLALTLAAVLTLILSGTLVQLAAAWIATSLCLHQLLTFFRGRAEAHLVARKKFVASRLGDLCLLTAVALTYRLFGTVEIPAILDAARAMAAQPTVPAAIHPIALLFAASALLKSAQFPFHVWLPEVMETPTPVSALLHAGIINAGGYLVIRLSPIVSLSTPALDLLLVVGGFTALFGSVVMLTQPTIKGALAWSTVAQMGFMLFECGLGAYSAAVVHLVAHSLYKAHAFLSSGSAIEAARGSRPVGMAPSVGRLSIALGGALAVTVAVAQLTGMSLAAAPGVFVLGAIFVMGLARLFAASLSMRAPAVVAWSVAAAAVAAAAYFTVQRGAEWLLAGAVPPVAPLRGAHDLVIATVAIAAFAAVTVLQGMLPTMTRSPRWQALYVHASRGFYVNAYANRLIARLWPVRAADLSTGVRA